jgi:VWFA-related protein
MRAACLVGLTIAASSTVMIAQQPRPYTERVEVVRVMLDARVLDDRGEPVVGLGADDFKVKIGGKAARVESATWISGAESSPQMLDSSEFRSSYDSHPGRLLVFVFQKSLENHRIAGFLRMLIEARGLIDTLTPADRVAVVSFDSRLHIWMDFTNDYDRVRRVFERGILFEHERPMQESIGPSLVRQLDRAIVNRTYTIESALTRLGEALEPLPGAKSVILVGHGFGRLGYGGVQMENEYADTRAALQAARASVFCLDVTEADYHSLEVGLQEVAEDTGGFYARTHLFHKRAMRELVGALAGHYVLFVERPSLGVGRHEISVTLTRSKGDVFARRDYVLTKTPALAPALECAVTSAGDAFVPQSPYPPSPASPSDFWYGTSTLWTMLPRDGTWRSLPHDQTGYTQKVFLWRPGYDGRAEQSPEVAIIGTRRDGEAKPLRSDEATNAFRRDFGGWAMLVEVTLPAPGCWDLTATYRDATLNFTVMVTP